MKLDRMPSNARPPAVEESRVYLVSPLNLARIVQEVNPRMCLVSRTLFADLTEKLGLMIEDSHHVAAVAGVQLYDKNAL